MADGFECQVSNMPERLPLVLLYFITCCLDDTAIEFFVQWS